MRPAYLSRHDVPDPLVSLLEVADAGHGALFIYHDNKIVGANAPGIALYQTLDWNSGITFDDCFWYGINIGRTDDEEITKDPAGYLEFAKIHRAWSPGHRFCRRHFDTGVIYDRHHVGIDKSWNAQVWLPVKPGSAIDFAITARTKAMDVRQHVAKQQALANLTAFLEQTGVALAVVDRSGRLVDATPAMVRLVCHGELLKLADDEVLFSPVPHVSSHLSASVRDVAMGLRSAALVPLSQSGGKAVLAGVLRNGSDCQTVLIAVSGQRHADEFEALLCEAFRLSPSEASVAIQVGDGHTAEEIAATTNRSITTIRGHLSSVKRKTGASRQHELSSIIARVQSLIGR